MNNISSKKLNAEKNLFPFLYAVIGFLISQLKIMFKYELVLLTTF